MYGANKAFMMIDSLPKILYDFWKTWSYNMIIFSVAGRKRVNNKCGS